MPNPQSGPSTDRAWYDDERAQQKAAHEANSAPISSDLVAKLLAEQESAKLEASLEAIAKKVEASQKSAV
jgi:hypothetical protein